MHHEARIQTVPFFMSPKLKPNSEVYKKNVQVQSWLQGTWFPKEKRWASAYREHKIDIKINTNNGVKAQNKVFKYNYLSKGTDKTLSGVAKVIVESFCLDQYKLYMLKNLKLNRNIKAYNSNAPVNICFAVFENTSAEWSNLPINCRAYKKKLNKSNSLSSFVKRRNVRSFLLK